MKFQGLTTVLSIVVVAWSLAVSGAAIDGFGFDDPEMESRYKALVAELRCPKCLNTNLAGSDAPIAVDLRRAVRRLLDEGKSDAEILAFLQSRYGDFVLYDPPFKASTALLWLLPAMLVVIGALVLWRMGQRRESVELTGDEQERLRALGISERE